ncbi:hypothetical protein PC121_g19908 [Phytophthora cactorum]|nr:hypothetical protein PC120_g20285 [Phytophthora cactorum]KAG3047696.1 hypothetical protein PC121_g19908 [Phytophthora cactorum]KAG4043720.1 hypothetical protein PC123_g20812 [Phytophthora cactorum]
MLRRNVEPKLFTTQHIGTEQMIADIMTKPLAIVKFTRFCKAMKVLPVVTSDYVYEAYGCYYCSCHGDCVSNYESYCCSHYEGCAFDYCCYCCSDNGQDCLRRTRPNATDYDDCEGLERQLHRFQCVWCAMKAEEIAPASCGYTTTLHTL